MRRSKALACFAWLVLAIMLASAATVMTANAADSALIWVEPEEQEVGLGDVFNVTLHIDNLPSPNGAAGVQFKLMWNPAILTGMNMTDVLYHSMTPESEWDNIWKIKSEINNVAGYAWYAYAFQNNIRAQEGGYSPISGNHTLAVVTLMGASKGESSLNVTSVIVGDVQAIRIPTTTMPGHVFVGNPPPTIIVVSPKNNGYSTIPVNLTIRTNKNLDWVGYSLDGNANITLTENMIQALEGPHDLVVFANDTSGQMAASNSVHFTADGTLPTAQLTYSPQTPEAKIVFGIFRWRFNFSASGSYDTLSNISSYFWDFGDGTNATGISAIHEFRESGAYDVVLTVTDGAGNVATQSQTITLNPPSEPFELSMGLVAAIVIPVIWVPALVFYLTRTKRKRKRV